MKKTANKKEINYVLHNAINERDITVSSYMRLKHISPFYCDVLLCLEKNITTSIPTACVTINNKNKVCLQINPEYFINHIRNYVRKENKLANVSYINDTKISDIIEINPDILFTDITENHEDSLGFKGMEDTSYMFRMAIIQHELLHIIFNHLGKFHIFPNKKMANVAMDLVVNQYIERKYLDVGCVFLDGYPELNLLPFESSEYYYNKLNELKNEVDKENRESESDENVESGGDGSGKSKESKGKKGKAKDSQSWKTLEKFLKEDDNHDWEKYSKLTSEEKKQFDDSLRDIIEKAYNKSRGKLPGNLSKYLDEFCLRPPIISWKNVLRLFIQNITNSKKKTSLNKRSRRTSAIPGARTKKQVKILVAIDTSGSVSDEELNTFMSEISHMYKTKNIQIDICQCDSEMKDYGNGKNIMSYKGTLDFEIIGRGGTDFNPPVELYNSVKDYAGLIYFTDGICSPPDVKMKQKGKLLWVVTNDNILGDEFEGKKVYLPKE